MTVERWQKTNGSWEPSTLLRVLLPVLQDAYVDAAPLVMQELTIASVLYLLRDRHTVQGFFLVAVEYPCRSVVGYTPVYVGLSALTPETRGTGSALLLYRAFIRDGQRRELENVEQCVVWGTTARPSVWRLFRSLFAPAAPAEGEAPTSDQEASALAIGAAMKVGPSPNPFYWPRNKPNVRYSTGERRRMLATEGSIRYQGLAVNEELGDRLLMVGRLPRRAVPL